MASYKLIRILIIAVFVAIVTLMMWTGVVAAQCQIHVDTDFPDPVPHTQGSYELYTMYDCAYEDTRPFWVVYGDTSWVYPDAMNAYQEWDSQESYVGPFVIDVAANPNGGRNGGVYIEYWTYYTADPNPDIPYFVDWTDEGFAQESGEPTDIYCVPNPIRISPGGAEVEVWFFVDVADINVDYKYTYNNVEHQAGPYYAEDGEFSITFYPEILAEKGTYTITAIRNHDGGTWRNVNYQYTIEELFDANSAKHNRKFTILNLGVTLVDKTRR
jgi:hypothetical protein